MLVAQLMLGFFYVSRDIWGQYEVFRWIWIVFFSVGQYSATNGKYLNEYGLYIHLMEYPLFILSHSSYAGASTFLIVQTPAPSSSGHKSPQLRGTERHTAGLPYACQSYAGASAFLIV
ncbi:hypothetical protein BBH88_06210 [Planococcus antarcticus DSM 14505]|uniref:Uncharacterized protein n=1 Tax=Planococcus antarcticus DSM 14505 TaxID=1185653 RepID=A0ABM6D311_9BACL|nr:hypothetical protein BBH88_06210 [Planococcus antarcticus DSM 14505]